MIVDQMMVAQVYNLNHQTFPANVQLQVAGESDDDDNDDDILPVNLAALALVAPAAAVAPAAPEYTSVATTGQPQDCIDYAFQNGGGNE